MNATLPHVTVPQHLIFLHLDVTIIIKSIQLCSVLWGSGNETMHFVLQV